MTRWLRWLAPLVPVGGLIAAVELRAPPLVYWHMILALVLAVVIVNPLEALDEVTAPCTRYLLAVSVALVSVASVPKMEDGVRMIVGGLALCIGAVALRQREHRLTAWREALEAEAQAEALAEAEREALEAERAEAELIMQSPIVDTILGQLSSNTTTAEAWVVWSESGMRQVRALLHQHLGTVCTDEQIKRYCRPAFLLAYYVGKASVSKALRAAQKSAKAEASGTVEKLERRMDALREQLEEAQQERKSASAEAERLRQQLSDSRREAAELREDVEALQRDLLRYEQIQTAEKMEFSSKEEKLAAWAEYKKTHTYPETAKHFGVPEGTVKGELSRYSKQKSA